MEVSKVVSWWQRCKLGGSNYDNCRAPNVSTKAQVDGVLGGGKQLPRSEFQKEKLPTVLGDTMTHAFLSRGVITHLKTFYYSFPAQCEACR